LAAELFGVLLARFHYLAYGAGAVLFLTLAVMAILGPRPAAFAIRLGIITVMLGASVYSGVSVIGEMTGIQRAAGTVPSSLPSDDSRRLRFDYLHQLSTRLMTFNVVAALALLYWEAREQAR